MTKSCLTKSGATRDVLTQQKVAHAQLRAVCGQIQAIWYCLQMKLLTAVFVVFCASVHSAGAQPVQAQSDLVEKGQPLTVEVTAGMPRSIMLDVAPGAVVVGNPEIADVNIVGSRSIVIVPKKVGVTGLVVTDKQGQLISSLTIPVNAASTVSIWNAGVPESLWCTSEACLSDSDIRQKNNNIESTKSEDNSLVGLLITAITKKNSGGSGAASGGGAAAGTTGTGGN